MKVQCRVHLQFTWRSSAGSISTISSSHGGPVQGPSPVHMEVQCRAHLQFTWRSSAGPISSSHEGPVQGPSPVHMEVQCRVHLHHLQFTWRSSAGSISSSYGGPEQGPSPVHMEVQCRVHLQFTWRSSASPVHMEVQCRVHHHLQFTWRSSAGSISSIRYSTNWAAASQGSIIKVPGLKDEVSTLIICIQAGHQFMWDQCNSKGPKRSPRGTPDSELIWSSGSHNRGLVLSHYRWSPYMIGPPGPSVTTAGGSLGSSMAL